MVFDILLYSLQRSVFSDCLCVFPRTTNYSCKLFCFYFEAPPLSTAGTHMPACAAIHVQSSWRSESANFCWFIIPELVNLWSNKTLIYNFVVFFGTLGSLGPWGVEPLLPLVIVTAWEADQSLTGPELGRVWHRKRQLQIHCDVSQSLLLVILCVFSRIIKNLRLDSFSPHSSVVTKNLQNLFFFFPCVKGLKAAVGSAGRCSGLEKRRAHVFSCLPNSSTQFG